MQQNVSRSNLPYKLRDDLHIFLKYRKSSINYRDPYLVKSLKRKNVIQIYYYYGLFEVNGYSKPISKMLMDE